MAKEVQNSRSGEIKKTAEDLDEFMNKVRSQYRQNVFNWPVTFSSSNKKAPSVLLSI